MRMRTLLDRVVLVMVVSTVRWSWWAFSGNDIGSLLTVEDVRKCHGDRRLPLQVGIIHIDIIVGDLYRYHSVVSGMCWVTVLCIGWLRPKCTSTVWGDSELK